MLALSDACAFDVSVFRGAGNTSPDDAHDAAALPPCSVEGIALWALREFIEEHNEMIAGGGKNITELYSLFDIVYTVPGSDVSCVTIRLRDAHDGRL